MFGKKASNSILATAGVAALAFSLTACDSNEEEPVAPEPAMVETESPDDDMTNDDMMDEEMDDMETEGETMDDMETMDEDMMEEDNDM